MPGQRSADEIRRAILDAVTDLAVEMPPDRLTTRAIAARAGVQQSVIFRYFGSKQALMDEHARRSMRAMARGVREELEIEDSLWHAYEFLCGNRELPLRIARAATAGQASRFIDAEPTDESRASSVELRQLAARRTVDTDDAVLQADLVVLNALVGGLALLAPYMTGLPTAERVDAELLERRIRRAIRLLVDDD